jgi:hypothetical protein
MSLPIGRFTPYQPLAATAPARAGDPSAAAAAPAATQAADTIVGAVPPFPAPEARAQVDRAADRVDELAAQNRELHFTHDESNRLVVQVRDLDGNVMKTVPPSKALDVMSGAEL